MKSIENVYISMKRKIKVVVLFCTLLLLLPASYYVYENITGNFHVITQGEAYRSAQLDKNQFKHYIKQYSIKSVLNLRGENADEQWYGDEVNICSSLGIAHYDVKLSAISEPEESDALEVVKIFKSAPRPILIHCQAGADRSGLVAAMWKVVVDGETKADAKKQMSILYGHLPFGRTQAMDRFYKRWNFQ
jgi:undecaprenyl-diphosphatase